MPSEQVEMARRGFEAFNHGEFDVLVEMLHEDVVAEVPEPFASTRAIYEARRVGRAVRRT